MDTGSVTAQDHLRKAIGDEIKVSEQVTRELKYHWNSLAPISRLPSETFVEIFSLLSFSPGDEEPVPYLEWICVTHVCHRWREVALCSPHLWNHINLTKLTVAGFTEILARAKMSPLHIEAKINPRSKALFNVFRGQLEAHISHTRHLSISGKFQTLLKRLVSPAPALVSLSLTNLSRSDRSPQLVIPDSLSNGTAPNLTRLELFCCSIGWKSPLLKGLQTLKIQTSSESAQAILTLEDWLAALNEMSQLKKLVLHNATPVVSVDDPLISEPQRAITLPSLTYFDIAASAKGCALALAHLVLPALISLRVVVESESRGGDDVRLALPYIARNTHGPQDQAPLQTIAFNVEENLAQIIVWTVPDAEVEACDVVTLMKAAVSSRLVLCVTSDTDSGWLDGTEIVIFDAMLSHLPLNAISTLSAWHDTQLSKEVWLSHAPKLIMLNRALLVSTAVRAFKEMLEEDVPPDGLPRLPRLTKLILSKVYLTAGTTHDLRDMLIKRKEHGAPLDVLDLRTCLGNERAIELLSETVGTVQGPTTHRLPAFFDWES